MNKIRKIYYIPGMITLIFAPIFFVAKLNKSVAETREYCIETIFKGEDDTIYNGCKDLKIPATRKYWNIELTGNKKDDSLTLLFAENFAKGLEQSIDTINGIKIILKNGIKYKTFIEALNCCLKSKISNYLPYKDTIYLYHEKRDCPQEIIGANISDWDFNKFGWGSDVLFPEPSYTLIQKIKAKKMEIIIGIPYLVLFIFLVIGTIRRLHRQNADLKGFGRKGKKLKMINNTNIL